VIVRKVNALVVIRPSWRKL